MSHAGKATGSYDYYPLPITWLILMYRFPARFNLNKSRDTFDE